MEIKQQGVVTSLYFDIAAGWEQSIYVSSDLHIDSINCNRDLLFKQLDEAKAKNSLIFLIGDIFDAMQGRMDKRRSLDELRPEYKREDYYDFVVMDVAKLLSPYAKNIVMISDGNHELSILKYANTNLSDRLVSILNRDYGAHAVHGGYGGYIRFMIKRGGSSQGSIKIKYFHGSGGEAPVTRGAIQTNRQAVYIADADIVINGHSHNSYYIPIAKERLGNKGNIYFDIQHYLRTPGYKQDYGDGSAGWEVTRGGVPKPIGCFWINLIYEENKKSRVGIQIASGIEAPFPVSSPISLFDGVVYHQDAEYP